MMFEHEGCETQGHGWKVKVAAVGERCGLVVKLN